MTSDSTSVPLPVLERPSFASLQQRLLEHRKTVFLLCLGFARNHSEAQDLTQETFLRAFEHIRKAPGDHLRPWLLQIARNCCIDNERRKKVRRIFMPWLIPSGDESLSAEQLLGKKEAIELVRRAIGSLPKKLREIVILREYNDLSYEEIAQILEIKPGTVMSRLSRGRRAVLKYYQEKQNGNENR